MTLYQLTVANANQQVHETSVCLISAFFFLGKGIKWKLGCLVSKELGKKGSWLCILIAKDRKAQEHDTAISRNGVFLPREPGVWSCWLGYSQESARNTLPNLTFCFLVFILSSLSFVVHSLNILVLLIRIFQILLPCFTVIFLRPHFSLCCIF